MSGDKELQFYLDEACYYLEKMGLNLNEISERVELPSEKVKERIQRHRSRIKEGEIQENEEDLRFWENTVHEEHGDVKVTFVEDGKFYHCRKSDLEKINGAILIKIFDDSKQFLELDPNYHYGFLNSEPLQPGFDPLAMPREVKKTVELIEKILSAQEEQSY